MNFDLKDKVAIVTGGAMGIGEAAARKLASEGAAVAIFDLNREAGEKTAAEIRSRGGVCDFFACNVSLASDVSRAVEAVVAKHQHLDILVSNAGVQDYGDVVTTTEQAWDQLISVNLKGCFLVSKFCVPHLLKRRNAAIVVVGSVQSMTAIGNSVAYVTAKHGLLGLTRAMALDYAQKGIRVNCVCPGAIDTPMLRWAASLDPDPEKVIRTCDRMHAMGRIGKPEEVADAIVYLASPLASFITGATLVVDGGLLVPTGGMSFQESGTGAVAKESAVAKDSAVSKESAAAKE
jgi:NAD(P)-dependent dehydrogenase (short-subunit alcohol dehydrogenase family)